MNENHNGIRINVWINEDRLEALKEAGLAEIAEEQFADMKLLVISTTEEQKNAILERYPSAKYDSSTTRSIELLPKLAKDKLFDLSMKMRSTGAEIIDEFLAEA